MATMYETLQSALGALTILNWIAPTERVATTVVEALERGDATVARWEYPDFDAAGVHAQLDEAARLVDASTDPVRELLAVELAAASESVDVIAARDDDTFTAWARGRYGIPSDDSIAAALAVLEQTAGRAEPGPHDATVLADLSRKALDDYGLDNWSVELAPSLVATMGVNSRKRLVRVRADAKFEDADLDRLMVHEIGSHVLRAENAHRQPLAAASIGLRASTATEEGFAAWHEERFGVARPVVGRRYAARLIAADAAQRLGVVPLAAMLEQHVGRSDAVAIAVRAKRGLLDPNAPGGFGKDQAYFAGLVTVRDRLASHPDDYGLLMATKWPVDLLPEATHLREQGLLADGELVPDERLLSPHPR